MKIAYLILAHSDPEGLRRLAEKLVSHGDIYVHINAKNNLGPFEKVIETLGEAAKKVHFVSKREKINWAGFSIVRATFTLLDDALKNDTYDRITLITGQDYPIKEEKIILDMYENCRDINFVTGTAHTAATKEELMLIDFRDIRLLHLFTKALIHPIQRRIGFLQRKDYVVVDGRKYTIYGLSPKWSITGDAARYLLDFYNKNKSFNRYFATRHASDDYYVATVLFNSKFRDRIDNKTAFFWLKFLPNDGGTKILDESDIDSIRETPALFARKFTSEKSEILYRLLEESEKSFNNTNSADDML